MQNLIAESRGISTNITGFIAPVEYIVLQANKPVEYQENIPKGVNQFLFFFFFSFILFFFFLFLLLLLDFDICFSRSF